MKDKHVINTVESLSARTNMEIHDGALEFYKKHGFISNINNVDCSFTVGNRECNKNVRNRFSL